MATLKKLTRVGADVRQIARLLQAKAPEGHMLAYITPEEAKLLKFQGGSGQEHEDTGVPSFEMGDSGGYDTGGFEGMTQEQLPDSAFPPQLEVGPAVTRGQPETANIAPSFNPPTAAPVQMDSGPTPALPPPPSATSGGPQMRDAATPFEWTPQQTAPGAIDTSKDTSTTIGQKYSDLAKSLGIKEETLGRLGIGGFQALLGAYQTRQAREDAESAKREQQGLAAPYQAKGAELQRAAQAGELTPASEQQLKAVQAQASQAASSRGGVGAQQSAAQIEAFRNQLLQQQYDYGLKLSGIGDQIALGAIKTGMQADQYVNQLTSSYYNNIARTLYGAPPQTAQQPTQGAVNG